MKKTIIQGVTTVALFFLTWFVLAQINWVEVLHIREKTDKTEKKLGELFLETFRQAEQEIDDVFVTGTIDSLINKLCTENQIDPDQLKIHILQKDEVNAFALPDGHLMIYSGLILNTENQEELLGVMGHEVAHIQLNHVMKKLLKEVGLSTLLSISTGNNNGNITREGAKVLSSTAFDRKFEKEADIKAVDYLANANVDPEPFATFLYRLAEDQNTVSKHLTAWIGTHPDSKERARYIIEYSQEKQTNHDKVINPETFKELQNKIRSLNTN